MFRFHALPVQSHLLQSALRYTQVFLRGGEIELHSNKIDLGKSALLRQPFHAIKQIPARLRVVLAEYHLARGLLDLRLLDLALRNVSGIILLQASFLRAQVLARGAKQRIPAANFIGAQNEKLCPTL